MGFLKKLFGGEKEYKDEHGIYFYVQCDHCGDKVQLRADKRHDLNRAEGGYVWRKTIVDSRCFRKMPTVVHLDRDYNVIHKEIEGGHYITKEEYEAEEPAADADEAPAGDEEPST